MSGNFTRCLFAKIAGGNPRNPLIRPGRFGEQTAYVWIARLRNGAASHTRPAGIFRRHESGIRHQFPRVPESRQIAEGDKVVTRLSGSGRHTGELMGAAPTGKTIKFTAVVISRFVGGKIAEEWAEFDALSFLQQLGAVPEFR